jgi:hypothetical protein
MPLPYVRAVGIFSASPSQGAKASMHKDERSTPNPHAPTPEHSTPTADDVEKAAEEATREADDNPNN